uniref:Uncharacterized protein n=1 Tax=Nelumbo nucifera TaxID=4432 RepID=A0A822YUM1_NELNU|nr:TPA_asm: hypothetical protein HUJ06_005759 [Nelumbo nucifera]
MRINCKQTCSRDLTEILQKISATPMSCKCGSWENQASSYYMPSLQFGRFDSIIKTQYGQPLTIQNLCRAQLSEN